MSRGRWDWEWEKEWDLVDFEVACEEEEDVEEVEDDEVME